MYAMERYRTWAALGAWRAQDEFAVTLKFNDPDHFTFPRKVAREGVIAHGGFLSLSTWAIACGTGRLHLVFDLATLMTAELDECRVPPLTQLCYQSEPAHWRLQLIFNQWTSRRCQFRP